MVRLDLILCRSGVAELVQLGCVPDCIVWFVSMLGLICIRLVDNLTKESIIELCVTSVVSRARPFTNSCLPSRKGLVTRAHTFGAPGMLKFVCGISV